MDPSELPDPEDTASALITAGLHLFGHQGFAATSTRQIAARAGVNLASIKYHFGSKDGLRAACAAAVAQRIASVLTTTDTPPPDTPAQAQAILEARLTRAVQFLCLEPEAEDAVAFMLREVTEAGALLERIYQDFLHPLHADLCALWALASGQDAESEETRLSVFAMIGQILYFRIARPVVRQRMGWDDIGTPEAEKITALLLTSFRLSLADAKRRRP